MKTGDWELLRKMRAGFLSARDGLQDYWESDRHLELYDRFFAARIGWKWDAVLGDLRQLGWQPPEGTVVDWGCGTGIASRKILETWPQIRTVECWDRSGRSREFAAGKIRAEFPGAPVSTRLRETSRGGVWLLSHVLNELEGPALEELLVTLAANAEAVCWIESGSYEVSRRLIAVRERLRGTFSLVSPCPQQGVCGMLTPENERHWCHFFAHPPSWVFQDAEWSAFSRELEIDLRALPYSYLVLDKRPLPTVKDRMIGRPRMYKGYARLLNCSAAGVQEMTLQKRDDPEGFRELKKT